MSSGHLQSLEKMNLYIIYAGSTTVYMMHKDADIDLKSMFVQFNQDHGKNKDWWAVSDYFLQWLTKEHGFVPMDFISHVKIF